MLLNDKYLLKKVIGQGGMGKVYLATNVETNTLVAVKDCILGEENSKKVLERIKREYYFMTKIDHPNIIKSVDFFAWQNRYFIVMDYICGMDLKTFIREKRHSISFEQQLEIAKQICGAVATLNNNGIVHRDIKPANILLQQDLRPILLDLGIAKSINNELATLTKSGDIIGTPEYLSPEQAHGKSDLLNSDVFSLGVLLYQFLAWMPKSPFDSSNVISTIYKVCNKKLPPLHKVLRSNDEKIIYVSKVINNALHKSPLRRTPSVEDMLKQFLQGGEEIRYFKPLKTNALARQRQKKRQNLKKRNLIVAFVYLAVSISILVVYYHQRTSPEMGSQYSEAMLFEYQNKHKLALESYSKAIAENPQHFKAYASRGNLYHLQGKFDLAKKDYDKSIAINPNYSNVYKARGNWYRDHKKFQLAKQDYNMAITLDPKYPQAYRARGHLHRDLQLYTLAEKDYTQAIAIDPRYENAYRSRGDLYRKMKKFQLAEKDYQTALKINPKNAIVHCHCGILYHVQNKIAAAITSYEKAIEFDDKYVDAYKYLGFIYYQRYQYMRAIEYWQKAINLGLPEEEVRDLLDKAKKYLRK